MARRRFGQAESGEDDVNVTPLLDIVFIMLIFFIVTSTFVKEPGVEIERPDASTATDRKLASILVAVTAENEIYVNKDQLELDELRLAVEALKRENPKGTAAIQIDSRADARFLVEVADQIRNAGVSDIAVSTEDL
ncbi:MAG: biopolymer transporter ExbD [Alphaproteobacteria bacterium]|nr:biopolymer transporter ExbD [Alphaproteobacteria bacterium]